MYKLWLVLAHLENPADFLLASTWLQLSMTNQATAHTLNDKSETQKVDIIPDIEVNTTLEDIKSKRDIILETAIKEAGK